MTSVEKNYSDLDEFSPRMKKYKKRHNKSRETENPHINSVFSSDDEVFAFMRKLQSENHGNFYQRDQQSKMKVSTLTRREANPAIKSYSLTFRCIFGKREESKGTGLRNAS